MLSITFLLLVQTFERFLLRCAPAGPRGQPWVQGRVRGGGLLRGALLLALRLRDVTVR